MGGDSVNTWPKICGCGREHYYGEWSSLEFVGYMPGVDDDGKDCRIELRNCPCASTLAIVVTDAGLTDHLRAELAEVCRNDGRELDGYQPPYSWPPKPRRESTAADREEAQRLYAIADELQGVDRTKGRAA